MTSAPRFAGRVVRLGDDVNTDAILPGPYLNLTDPEQLGAHLLETYDAALGAAIEPGDVLVAGANFGCGSSREQAPVAILARGVRAIVASSFSRIFLRNAINLGLPVLESAEAAATLTHGETITVDLGARTIEASGGRCFTTPAAAPFINDLLAAGGIVAWTRSRLAAAEATAAAGAGDGPPVA
jgi:3-isopropylmalate/(R)-2-methylmalate dehydratase small subunit